jgi:hypothetical protein
VVRGEATVASKAIESLSDVIQCTFEKLELDRVRLSISAQSDVREAAAAALIKAGLGLQELNRTQRSDLENIFLQLTGGGAT